MDNSKKLGLPIEYQQLPEYFDAHNTDAHGCKENMNLNCKREVD